MEVRLLILCFLYILGGCLPEAQVSKGKVATQTGNAPTPLDPAIPQTPTQWNYLASDYKSITIFASNLNNAYLTGYETETYLSLEDNFKNQNYCLVTDYTLAGVKRQMRTRVVPVSYYDFSAKRTVKVFRVDFNVVSQETRQLCARDLYSYNSLGEYVLDAVPDIITYSADELCPFCTARLSSTKVRLFKASSALYEVPVQSIKLTDLTLIVDPNSGNSGTPGNGSCSISSCQAQGYDCCLDNQCVDNSATRPSAEVLYSEQFKIAEEERKTDPLAWMKYPHIYYICPNYVPPTPGTSTGGSGGGTTGSTGPDYGQGLTQIKKDLACLEHIKAQSPSTPFHQDLLIYPDYQGTQECLTDSAETSNSMHFHDVAKRLYSYCGCSYRDLDDMISYCPAYYYKVLTTDPSSKEPTSFECQILKEETIPSTQEVSVSSRSAPHRFFNNEGVEFSSPDQSHVVQEGDNFYYLDEDNNHHYQENFGMNAILGPMSLTLDKALPAKQVKVELDQMYLIRTVSGYYTPCPSCGKDKWHESLTAYPTTNWGVGLQAVGFSTKRDAVDGNVTGGNYEDTIFGRACWVPPTMLPFTHQAIAGLGEAPQRKTRLETQAVLYSNGYQRDWFGFNKGALIGSFDGVSWFAIGNGRLVKSTGKKLYLAINAPFADLASATVHNVQISLYDGHSTAPQVDYDPQYHLSHPLQNQGANCQANHMCETDADCITRLGWEYACADVSQLKTTWPHFDANTARELVDSEVMTIDQILAQKRLPSGDKKRCVYRGAGSLCLGNSGALTDVNTKKLMTCAPNFHCAPLTSSQNISGKVSRFATDVENIAVNNNHLFGQDANILGRPLNYLGESVQIPSLSRAAIASNIQANLPPQTSIQTAGICRPGKLLPPGNDEEKFSNPFEQHKGPDSLNRTDFISQLASCNASLYTEYRQSSCPVLDESGNYLQFMSSSLPTNYHLLASRQNACGLESISTDLASLKTTLTTLHQYSAFSEIEALPLTEKTTTTKTLARDACFRRAGAVCHTDLECSPNKMHAEAASFKALRFFGNQAEKTYWEEYLVCGQADPKPSIYDVEANKNYDHTLNRCCREVGKDLTTITTDTPRSTLSGEIVPHTQGLLTTEHPGTIANKAQRYSRFTSVENLGTLSRPTLSANTNRNGAGFLTSADNIGKAQQWKTLRETNADTCCGGGWIRKFSDGSNDWSQMNRVYFDVNNFSCINSSHPILSSPESVAHLYNSPADVRNLINRDYHEYCQDVTGTDGSCAQFSFASGSSESPPPGLRPFGVIDVNTRIGNFGTGNTDYLFTPFSGDAHKGVTMVYNSSTTGARKNLNIRIPSYIPRIAFDIFYASTPEGGTHPDLPIYLSASEGSPLQCYKKEALKLQDHTDRGNTSADPEENCTAGCCYTFDSSSRILKVAVASDADNTIRNNEAGILFSVDLSSLSSAPLKRTTPANDLYYLNRLSRIELSGIPQITYEPLYCNDNANNLVPGIFKSALMKTESDFENATHSFYNEGKWQTTHHALVQDPVFSEDKFKCCMPLGKSTTNQGNCCSGFGVKNENANTFTCSLPTGTDLMVYLNPFVSNEGFNLGLTEGDFDDKTGEPTLSTSVVNKISQIGREHCQGKKVRQGGVFGQFEPEPQGTRTDVSKRIYQITDSANDAGQVTNAGATLSTGYNVFNQGFRWNHHLYCTE